MEITPPIIIPSRSIYKKQNPKVLDNVITSIKYIANKDILENQKIFNSRFGIFVSNNGEYSYDINNYTNVIAQNSYKPTNSDRVFVNSGKYEYHYAYFKIQNLEYGKPTKKTNCNITISQEGTDYVWVQENGNAVSKTAKLEYNNNLVLGQQDKLSYSFKEYNSVQDFEEDLSSYDFETSETKLGYVHCGIIFRDYDFDILLLLKTYEKNAFGSYFRIQQSYNIEINLDLLNVNEENNVIGEGNKPLSFDGNELMQTSNALNTPINDETNAVKYLYGKTLNAFKKGKETATIRCSISDYYNESGEKVINIESDKMSFKIGDEVIPYIYGANGQDIPMSRYQNGSPKVFIVVGTNIIYDGAVWQELTLIEKTIDN